MKYTKLCVALGLVAALSACKRDNASGNDSLAQDSSLTRDLQLANRDSSAQPQLKDVPVAQPPTPPVEKPVERRVVPQPRPTPRATRPEPQVAVTPPPTASPVPQTTQSGNTVVSRAPGSANSEGTVGVVPVGTTIGLTAGQRVCTNTNRVGDRITASLAESVNGSNGVTIPAGSTAVLEVTSLGRSDQAGESMNIGLVVKSISYGGKSYPVNGEITDAAVEKVKATNNNDAAKVLGGAAVGAILGHILGGRSTTRGTIIGAAGGAAAGAVVANQTAKYDACLPSGARVSVRLDTPMSVQATPATTPTAPSTI